MSRKLKLLTLLLLTLPVAKAETMASQRDTMVVVMNAEWNDGNIILNQKERTYYGAFSIQIVSDASQALLTIEGADKRKFTYALERNVSVRNYNGPYFSFKGKYADKILEEMNKVVVNYFGIVLDTFSSDKENAFMGYFTTGLGDKDDAYGWSKVYYNTLTGIKKNAVAEMAVGYIAESNYNELKSFTESIMLGTHPYFRISDVKGKPLSTFKDFKGTVKVESSPAGAEVLLGDSLLGYTPFVSETIPSGKYKLTVKKQFHKTYTEDIIVSSKTPVEKNCQLESSIPVKINSNARSAQMRLNGSWRYLPFNGELAEGTYDISVPRQYDSWYNKGWCKKNTSLRIDSTHTTHYVKLTRDNNYDKATFFGVDYDTSLGAVGVNFGSNPGKHFMFELNFFWGLKKSETIYWTGMKTAKLSNYDLQAYEYNHWAVDLRMGPTFWCGPFLRISPELGAQYLKLRESEAGGKNTKDKMFTGAYVSALASMRFRLSLSNHIGLHVTPEYRLNVSGKKMLPDVSKDVDKWINGFSVKGGLVYFFR